MKVAISSTGPQLDSPMDPRFGRAAAYIIYDLVTDDFEVLDNTANASVGQGAGIQSAQAVVDAGAEAVITGRVGPKAYAALSKAGVRIITVDAGTVAEALEVSKNIPEGAEPRMADEKSGLNADSGTAAEATPGMGRGMGAGQGRGMGPCGGGMARGGRGMGGGGRGMGGGGRGMGGGMGRGRQ